MKPRHVGFVCLASGFLVAVVGACGGTSNPATTPNINPPTAPTAPTSVTMNAGDTAVSLGWLAPASDGNSPIQNYVVSISPAVSATLITIAGTSAIITGLTNGESYTATIAAKNAVGVSPVATSPVIVPTSANASNYKPIVIAGDNSPSGIYDPSLLAMQNGQVWLAYSSVNYYSVSGHTVQDVSTRIAQSGDGGKTFSYIQTVGAAQPATVTDASGKVCGAQTCTGRWVYEVPWLVDDASDPDGTRRYKLFAHKYFLYPPASPSTNYQLGAIVMWTAATPYGSWSAETHLLGWNLTPPELTANVNINAMDPALGSCLLLTEGGAATTNSGLDFVFSCAYFDSPTSSILQKIILLRTADHANTFQYVATLLQPSDANTVGADYYGAPALLPTGSSAPVLIATPVIHGSYSGCVVFPFADVTSGTLFRSNGAPVSILKMTLLNQDFGGACAWDGGVTATGILMDDVNLSATPPFRILATGKSLQ